MRQRGNPWDPDPDTDLLAKPKKKKKAQKNKTQQVIPHEDSSEDDWDIATVVTAAAPPQNEADRQAARYRRERKDSCWCGRAGGCKELDECCFEDSPEARECPCRSKLRPAVLAAGQDGAGTVGRCEQCLEDGLKRPCCKVSSGTHTHTTVVNKTTSQHVEASESPGAA
jgi:hypothetical protein